MPLRRVSLGAGDATLILRVTALRAVVWFDACAPHHPTAVGIASRLRRRPSHEATDAARNVAILHASVPILPSLFPTTSRSGTG